jgi:hypothetical protein
MRGQAAGLLLRRPERSAKARGVTDICQVLTIDAISRPTAATAAVALLLNWTLEGGDRVSRSDDALPCGGRTFCGHRARSTPPMVAARRLRGREGISLLGAPAATVASPRVQALVYRRGDKRYGALSRGG